MTMRKNQEEARQALQEVPGEAIETPARMRCGAYIRVSTPEQGEKFSPDTQLAAIKNRIIRDGGRLIRVYEDFESGRFLETRIAMQRALSDMEGGLINALRF